MGMRRWREEVIRYIMGWSGITNWIPKTKEQGAGRVGCLGRGKTGGGQVEFRSLMSEYL